MTIQSMFAWVTLLWLRSDNPNAKSHVSWTSTEQPNNPSNTLPGDHSVYLKMGGRLFMAIKWKLYETVYFVKPGMKWGAVHHSE